MASTTFGIAETDDYVRKILGRAGDLPTDDPEATWRALIPHVMHQESRGNPRAVSPKGAVGTMQTMPATLRDPGFGVTPARDDSDAERERVGKEYLRAMVLRYPGRPDLALAAYNAGPGRADKWAAQGGAPVNPTVQAPAGNGEGQIYRASAGVEGITPLAPHLGDLPERDTRFDKSTVGDFFRDVIGVDSSVGAFQRFVEDAGYDYDPNFSVAAIPAKQWEQITQGIPEEMQAGLGAAASLAHLQAMAARTRAQLQAEEEIASFGGWGMAGRFAIGALDPLTVGLGIATGGIGSVAYKGARLAQAAELAVSIGNLGEARAAVAGLESIAKGSSWMHTAKTALFAGAENAGIQSFLDSNNLTRDGWDVAFAGLTGAFMGGVASRVFHGRELANVRKSFLVAQEHLKLAELDEHISGLRSQLDTKLKWLHADGDVAKAQHDIRMLQQEIAQAASERRQALTERASGALKRSELGKLRRDLEGLRRQSKDADQLEGQIKARMLDEDIASMGEKEAHSKARTKLRDKAAKAEARARKETIQANLERAETAYHRATAAEDARTELRKVERREKSQPNDPLQYLDAATKDKFAERELALVKAKKAAEDAVGARKAALEKQIADLERVRQEGVQAIDKITSADAQVFGKDSGGAARFEGFTEALHPHLEDSDSGLPVLAKQGAEGTRGKIVNALSARKGPLATFSMILRGSEVPEVRELGRIVGNSIGNADGSVNEVGASEIAHTLRQRLAAKFYSAVEPAYKDWGERNGLGRASRMTRRTRNDFMSAVGEEIRTPGTYQDPAILKATAGVRKVWKEYLQEAKDAGVKGFENVEVNDNYLPRVFDFHKIGDIEDRMGTDALRRLIEEAILLEHEDMPPKIAKRVAHAYVKRMKELRVGSDVGLMQGMRWDDVGFLRRFLDEAGVEREEVDSVVNEMAALNARRKRQDEGSFRNAKRKVQFDESHRITVKDQVALRGGEDANITVAVSDLFENNVEALFQRYNRSVSGHIGLAKVGFKSHADWKNAIGRMENALERNPEELKRVRETAEVAYQLLTGVPIENANALTRLGRAARDLNFATTMGQAGWAQFPDFAGLLQRGYFGHTMRALPEVFKTFRRTDGRIDVDFYRELEEWIGLGTDLHNNQVFSSFDWGDEGVGLSGVGGKLEHGIRLAGRGVQRLSGLGPMTSMAQRMAGRAIVQRLVKDVVEGGQIAEHRALQLGLDEAMKGRIRAQLKAHTEFANGDFGGKVRIVNYAKWDDVEARDAMLHAVSREARRLVQEEDLGDTAMWMHTHLGKIISQFRRFALVSYSKQLLHGIAHADAEEATRALISSALAALAYKARHEVAAGLMEAGGKSDEDVADYREKFLSMDRLTAATIANSTYASVLPGLWDSTVGMVVGERFFNVRNSDLASDFLTGNPTFSLAKNLSLAVGGSAQAVLRGDREFTKGNAYAWRRLAPFENVLGMDLPYSALTADLPDRQEDPEPDRIDWFLNDNPQ